MDWGTLAGTALGGLLGVGSTIVADRFRWKRDHIMQERVGRRELYSGYLAALSLATHRLYDLQRSAPPQLEDRKRLVGDMLTASGVYELRYQMLIVAPEVLEGPVEHAFSCLRTLRDCFGRPAMCRQEEWDEAIAAINKAIEQLKRAMRASLTELERQGYLR